MLLKKIGLSAILLIALQARGQQLVRATDVQMVSEAGTRVVISGGGITFKGTANWLNNGETHMYKTSVVSPEGWLDSTATGVLSASSTGNVFFRGNQRQSFFGKTRFYDLTIRNTAGDTLLSSCEVRNILNLDTGYIFTHSGYANDSLWVSNATINAIASTSSFSKSWVNGRLSRSANVIGSLPTFYLFPVGKTDSLFAPVRMEKQNANLTVWTAEYFMGLPFDPYNVFSPPIDHISRKEYWEITGNAALAVDNNARPSLSWRGYSQVSSLAAVRDSLIVAQYIDRPPFMWDVPGGWVTGMTNGTDSLSGWVRSNTNNNFSFLERRFTLGTNSKYNGLPVKLIYFTAIADGNRVRLNWEVANEQDTRLYELEKSLNGRDFVHLSNISSRQLLQSSYVDYDPSPVQGWNYYRLKVIDKTNAYFYSPIRQVKFEKGNEELRMFPNPATTVLNILLPSSYTGKVTLQVYGMDGRLISSMRPTSSLVTMNVSAMASGSYVLQVLRDNGNKETYQFVKQ